MDSNKKEGQLAWQEPNSGTEQPKVIDSWTEQLFTITVNWEEKKLTREEIEKWFMMQSDYTKKTQALSEEKKNISNPELEETKKVLQELWFATIDELSELKKFRDETLSEKQKNQQEKDFNNFVSQFNTLTESQKNILKDLKKVYTDKSYDDILESSGFLDSSLLERAKQWRKAMWDALWVSKEKPKEVLVDPKILEKKGWKPKSEIDSLKSKFWL